MIVFVDLHQKWSLEPHFDDHASAETHTLIMWAALELVHPSGAASLAIVFRLVMTGMYSERERESEGCIQSERDRHRKIQMDAPAARPEALLERDAERRPSAEDALAHPALLEPWADGAEASLMPAINEAVRLGAFELGDTHEQSREMDHVLQAGARARPRARARARSAPCRLWECVASGRARYQPGPPSARARTIWRASWTLCSFSFHLGGVVGRAASRPCGRARPGAADFSGWWSRAQRSRWMGGNFTQIGGRARPISGERPKFGWRTGEHATVTVTDASAVAWRARARLLTTASGAEAVGGHRRDMSSWWPGSGAGIAMSLRDALCWQTLQAL